MEGVIRTFISHVLEAAPGEIVGVYLYGSSTTTGLSPESDVDLLLLTRRSLRSEERRSLVSALLGISGWKGHASEFPEVADRRPLEVTSLVVDEIEPLSAEPWCDFQFGEWRRSDFRHGTVPARERDPDVVILLATAWASHRVLHGSPLGDVVIEVPPALLRKAQLATLPALVAELPGDERNVLLTLARALCTIEKGVIVSKLEAAELAARRVSAEQAELLRWAAKEHLGEAHVDWSRESGRSSRVSQSLLDLIHRASAG